MDGSDYVSFAGNLFATEDLAQDLANHLEIKSIPAVAWWFVFFGGDHEDCQRDCHE